MRYSSRSTLASGRVYRHKDARIRAAALIWSLLFSAVIVRLFFFMVVEHAAYVALASTSREVSATLYPKRGTVSVQDTRTGEEYPFAMNRDYAIVYADTRQLQSDEAAKDAAEKIAGILGYDEETSAELFAKLQKRTDPYEPIEQKVDEKTRDAIAALGISGIGFVKEPYRFYPEGAVGGPVIGFVGKDADGRPKGQYGVEGFWEKELAGSGGVFEGLRSARGRWIPLAGKLFNPAEDGADLVLSLDRTLEWKACDVLKRAAEAYGAGSASLILMDPHTGAIRAMCSVPDFDPNHYGKVASAASYNNTGIYTPYEPGSVFKPLTLAAALNEGLMTPNTPFTDTGSRDAGCKTAIRNAENKIYGLQTMTGVLEQSINTGVIFAVEKLGKKKFLSYVHAFGFGVKSGIDLNSEEDGDISSLGKGRDDGLDCYAATASFGQGIATTPIQLAAAFSAIANGGVLMRPYIVQRVRYADGRVEETRPREIRRVVTERTASLVRGMMVSTVDKGHSKSARVPGYYVGGKTGTAQIAGLGGYIQDTNHTFVGFAPAEHPKFVMVVKFEKPARAYADSTASPVFGEIAKFALQYYGIAPTR